MVSRNFFGLLEFGSGLLTVAMFFLKMCRHFLSAVTDVDVTYAARKEKKLVIKTKNILQFTCMETGFVRR